MITLYKYLRESLLDDFDDMVDKQHNSMLEQLFFEADKESGIIGRDSTIDAWRNSSYRLYKGLKINGENVLERSRVEDGVLKLGMTSVYYYFPIVDKKLQDIKSILPYDTIWVPKSMTMHMPVVDDKIADVINIYNGNLELGYKVERIENITFNISINSCSAFSPAVDVPKHQVAGPVTFKNCTISNMMDSVYINSRMRFHDIPTFENCKINGIGWVSIYGANVLKGKNLALFESMLDPKHQAVYSSKPVVAKYLQPTGWNPEDHAEMVIKKGTFKQVYACLNNPKKYNFVPTEEYGTTMFKINPKFKLSDIFDVSGFNMLDRITIADNNIGIIFFKADSEHVASGTGFSGLIQDWNRMDLPNDKDWKIIICKK